MNSAKRYHARTPTPSVNAQGSPEHIDREKRWHGYPVTSTTAPVTAPATATTAATATAVAVNVRIVTAAVTTTAAAVTVTTATIAAATAGTCRSLVATVLAAALDVDCFLLLLLTTFALSVIRLPPSSSSPDPSPQLPSDFELLALPPLPPLSEDYSSELLSVNL